MQIKYLNLSILIIIILFLQLIINNTTILYIDCLTLLLVAFLLDGLFPVRLILIVSLLADLFGHWYLGTHLLAITLISYGGTATIVLMVGFGILLSIHRQSKY